MGRFLLESQANVPTEANPKTKQGFNDRYFDTNMVIILAALLCALICALSLNYALRCALRITRRFTSNHIDHQDANANSGVKKRALRQIPVGLYGPETMINMKETECLICLGDFVEKEKIRVLPKCKHGFHVKCIDTWLLSRSSCPTCRQSLLIEQPSLISGGSRRDDDVADSGSFS